jgi:hypothetical protein
VGFPPRVRRYVLASEVAAGRVREEDGRYSIAPGAFDRETLLALRTLGPLDPDDSRPAAPGDDDRLPSDDFPSEAAIVGREALSA